MYVCDSTDSRTNEGLFWKSGGLEKLLDCVEAHLALRRILPGLGRRCSRITKSWITQDVVLQKGFGNFDH